MMVKLSPEQERIERDRRMIEHPLNWPRWPWLPMKRADGDQFANPFLAVMFANVVKPDGKLGGQDTAFGGPLRIYLSNLHDLDGVARAIKVETGRQARVSEVLARFQVKEFADLDALLAEWRVD